MRQPTIEQKPIDWLHPPPRNPRIHPESSIAAIQASIERFGFLNPIIALPDGTIIAGEGRYRASKEKKLPTVPVVVVDMTQEEALSFMIVDNATTELSDWQADDIMKLLTELESTSWSIESISVDMDELLQGTSLGETFAFTEKEDKKPSQDIEQKITLLCTSDVREALLEHLHTLQTELQFRIKG